MRPTPIDSGAPFEREQVPALTVPFRAPEKRGVGGIGAAKDADVVERARLSSHHPLAGTRTGLILVIYEHRAYRTF
jgi:hypothetical protein